MHFINKNTNKLVRYGSDGTTHTVSHHSAPGRSVTHTSSITPPLKAYPKTVSVQKAKTAVVVNNRPPEQIYDPMTGGMTTHHPAPTISVHHLPEQVVVTHHEPITLKPGVHTHSTTVHGPEGSSHTQGVTFFNAQ